VVKYYLRQNLSLETAAWQTGFTGGFFFICLADRVGSVEKNTGCWKRKKFS